MRCTSGGAFLFAHSGAFRRGKYEGLLIKESLSDERIPDYVEITNVDIWVTDNNPKY